MVATNPQKIEGRWQAGIALDFHTISSTPIGQNEAGHMQFDTARPPIAELLFQLKYRNNQVAAHGIVTAAAGFLRPHLDKFDLIIPVPSSTPRAVQPVLLLARGIGQLSGKPVVECITTTRPTTQLKGVTDPERRRELLEGLYAVDARLTRGKRILLFDDLYRSGSTMNAITDLLLGAGGVTNVRALTITRTRSHR